MHKFKSYKKFTESAPYKHITFTDIRDSEYQKTEEILLIKTRKILKSLTNCFDIKFVETKLQEFTKKAIIDIFDITSDNNTFKFIYPCFSDKFNTITSIDSYWASFITGICEIKYLEIKNLMELSSAFFPIGNNRHERLKNCLSMVEYNITNQYPAYKSHCDLQCPYKDLETDMGNEKEIEKYCKYFISYAEQIFGNGWKIQIKIYKSILNSKYTNLSITIVDTNKI